MTGDRVAPDALGRRADRRVDALGRVPFATEATRAITAARAELADRVELADRATRATTAADADRATVAGALSAVDATRRASRSPMRGCSPWWSSATPGTSRSGGGFVRDPDSDLPFAYGSAPVAGAWRLDRSTSNIVPGVPVRGTAYAICVKVDGA